MHAELGLQLREKYGLTENPKGTRTSVGYVQLQKYMAQYFCWNLSHAGDVNELRLYL
jgi:hypothetical protein